MIIGIDANEANLTKNRVGVNQYAFSLLHALVNLKTEHKFVVYLKNPPQSDMPDLDYRVIPFPKLWTQTRLPWDLYTHLPRPDVFFSMTHYSPRFSPVPTVVAIMDLGFLKTPEQFTAIDFNQLKSWTEYSVRQAKKVIAISEYTKKDIIATYHRRAEDITVTYLAYDKKLFMPSKKPKGDYFLFLGSLKPSKNVEGLIRAYRQGNFQQQLLIAGKKAWLYDEIFNLVKSLNLEEKVIFKGFISEEEVPGLIGEARALVMPSFYEGFGIPVLEAMASGTPVVISDVASLPEVAGDAGIYVNPSDPSSIMEGMRVAIGPVGKIMAKKGLARAKLFDWGKCARETLTCLQTATTTH